MPKKPKAKWLPPWPDEDFMQKALKQLRDKGATAPEQELRDQIDVAYRNQRDKIMKSK